MKYEDNDEAKTIHEERQFPVCLIFFLLNWFEFFVASIHYSINKRKIKFSPASPCLPGCGWLSAHSPMSTLMTASLAKGKGDWAQRRRDSATHKAMTESQWPTRDRAIRWWLTEVSFPYHYLPGAQILVRISLSENTKKTEYQNCFLWTRNSFWKEFKIVILWEVNIQQINSTKIGSIILKCFRVKNYLLYPSQKRTSSDIYKAISYSLQNILFLFKFLRPIG